MLKLFKPFISYEARQNVERVLLTDQIAEGQEVKDFEYELENMLNVTNLVTVNSGTTALELAYELAGIGDGDEVIVPVLTCTATNIPLVRRGAKIVWADIDSDLNMDIKDVQRKITSKTKMVVFVHFGGNNRGLAELLELCKFYNITLVEDAAQAIASDYWGKADFTAVSLQAIKTITSGDGGFLICKNKEDYKKAKMLRWFGYDRELKQKDPETDLTLAGYKYHMNNISAAIGRGNLLHLPGIIAHTKALAEIYRSYGLFTHAWLAGGFTEDYMGLKQVMADAGYEIAQYHYRNDINTIFHTYEEDLLNNTISVKKHHLPNMDRLEGKYFFVPYHMGVTLEDAHNIGKIYENLS